MPKQNVPYKTLSNSYTKYFTFDKMPMCSVESFTIQRGCSSIFKPKSFVSQKNAPYTFNTFSAQNAPPIPKLNEKQKFPIFRGRENIISFKHPMNQGQICLFHKAYLLEKLLKSKQPRQNDSLGMNGLRLKILNSKIEQKVGKSN